MSTYESYFDMLENFNCHQDGSISRIDHVCQHLAGAPGSGQDDHDDQPAPAGSVRSSKQQRSPSDDEGDEYARRTPPQLRHIAME
jgi:hypothetical protein